MAAKCFLLASILSSIALGAPVLEDRQTTCVALYGQCGGGSYSGSTCCASGSTCVFNSQFYSQCLPGTASSSSSTASTSSTSPASTSTVAASTSAASSSSATTTTKASSTVIGATTTASYTGNPFLGVQQWANSYYASEISAYAIPTLAAAQATKAAAVAKVPTFQWLYVQLAQFLVHLSLTWP